MLQALAEVNSLSKSEIWKSDGFRMGDKNEGTQNNFFLLVIFVLISVFAILTGGRKNFT